ncbi:hypothetical protein MMC13_004879 [Lambiella insularis]|nr:hypothetical protein [Lambiella insularis]
MASVDQGSTMAKEPMHIIIVGGSLAGLMHGILLSRLGHTVRILERNPSSTSEGQGAGIQAHERMQEFLLKHELTQLPYAVTSPHIQVLKAKCENVLYYRLRANYDGLTSEFCPEIPQDVAARRKGKALFEQGKKVTSLTYADRLVTVSYEDSDGGSGTYHADLLLEPETTLHYAGYVVWRGLVAESEVSPATRATFLDKTTVYTLPGSYILLYLPPSSNRKNPLTFPSYTIPSPHGSLRPGTRLLNYVWYWPCPRPSAAYTRRDDRHLLPPPSPPGAVAHARQHMPTPFAELVEKTKQPFVAAVFCEGRVLLVGDAFATLRPHAGASSNQVALGALGLEGVVRGVEEVGQWEWERGLGEWEREVGWYAEEVAARSRLIVEWAMKGWWGIGGAVGR